MTLDFPVNSAKLSGMQVFALLVPLFFLAIGCREDSTATTTGGPPTSSPAFTNAVASLPPAATAAQPKLQTVKLWIGMNELSTEVAITSKQIHTGMMWRTNM